jgi:hypothetical protein
VYCIQGINIALSLDRGRGRRYDYPMLNHITTATRYAITGIIALLIIGGAVMGGTLLGGHLNRSIDEAMRPEYRADALADGGKAITRTQGIIHQGWGEGDCVEDEWFDGYACIHLDLLPADDPRRDMTDHYYTY